MPIRCGRVLRHRGMGRTSKACANGHEIDNLDLYAEGFEPVLTAEERAHYKAHSFPRAAKGAIRVPRERLGEAGVDIASDQ